MKLGLIGGYAGYNMDQQIERIRAAESMGFDSVWTSEAYGSDAVSPAAWILARTDKIRVGTAIMQMPARTPACTAMTAMTLNQMSGGRFIIGLGASGPQVVEGWHGVAYGRPMTRMREYIEILHTIMARQAPAEHQGYHYSMPYQGSDGTGLGKPLKSILPAAPDIPIYTASITPRGVQTSAELADGFFPIWMDPAKYDVFAPDIEKGLAQSGRSLLDFDIAPFVTCVLGDNEQECRAPIKANLALYIGGMGARGKNFYNDYAKALGYEEEAIKIQDLYLDRRRDEAAAAVPDELVDAMHLSGPKEKIIEQLKVWKAAGERGHVSSMMISCQQAEGLELIASEML
ncbi:MAG: LLM class F420-dependent oxidoreductase [Proteobacteria bacterium]|jgi:F420-dependent oxidoreductase-like protein|nr:LLM class F420-dependent oxidoreductase [Pseudomonadota bacterium]MDA1302255.1 LLM class F420-dependent oxidoreductase [Pseudomonadota bacterium]